MATYSSIPVWEVPWTEEPDRLQFTGGKTVRHSLGTKPQQTTINERRQISVSLHSTSNSEILENNNYIISLSVFSLNYAYLDAGHGK